MASRDPLPELDLSFSGPAGMRAVFLILRYRLLSFRRWLGDHAFSLFILGPLLIGGWLWILDRYLDLLRQPLRDLIADPRPGKIGLGWLLALLWTVALLPAARRELLAADGVSVALPVSWRDRWHAALAVVLFHNLGLALAILGAVYLLSAASPSAATVSAWALALAAVAAHLTLVEGLWVLVSIRRPVVFAAALGLLFAAGAWWPPLATLAGLLWAPAATVLETVVAQATAPSASATTRAPWALTVAGVLLYGGCRELFRRRWRRALELVRQQRRRRRFSFWPLLLRGLRQPLRVQLLRDLRLVGRGFSPAVPLAALLVLWLWAAVAIVLPTTSFDPAWVRRLALLGCVAAAYACVALVPFLVRYELPRFWIEAASGVDRELVWRTKLWLARCLALPAIAIGSLVMKIPLSAAAWLGASLQLVAAVWILASLIGLATFEIAEHPGLGLVFGSLVGLALAALFVFYPDAWWLWILFYVFVAGALGDRATRRVRLTEVGL